MRLPLLFAAAVCAGVLSTPTSAADDAPAPAFAPSSSYETRSIRGWTVRVRDELLAKKPDLANQVLTLLESKLIEIEHVVPAAAVTRLREVPIWVEWKDPHHPCMCYHPSPDWLRENGMNPDKARSVEIAGAANFIFWTRQQPSMVLHELAHAYHHRVLADGYENRPIRETLDRARAEKLYDRVMHWDGRDTEAYGRKNPMEYFAEATEAYYGTNDFYPFVRAELKKHDPRMADLLEQLWNLPEGAQGAPESPSTGEGHATAGENP